MFTPNGAGNVCDGMERGFADVQETERQATASVAHAYLNMGDILLRPV
jgi:hypothetical protein